MLLWLTPHIDILYIYANQIYIFDYICGIYIYMVYMVYMIYMVIYIYIWYIYIYMYGNQN